MYKKLKNYLCFEFSQFRIFRKWHGGTWYRYWVRWLPMGTFWCTNPNMTSCGAEIIETEEYK